MFLLYLVWGRVVFRSKEKGLIVGGQNFFVGKIKVCALRKVEGVVKQVKNVSLKVRGFVGYNYVGFQGEMVEHL